MVVRRFLQGILQDVFSLYVTTKTQEQTRLFNGIFLIFRVVLQRRVIAAGILAGIHWRDIAGGLFDVFLTRVVASHAQGIVILIFISGEGRSKRWGFVSSLGLLFPTAIDEVSCTAQGG